MNKICTNCKEEKSVSEFNKFTRNKDGLDTHCKNCRSQKNKLYRNKNDKKLKETRRKYYHNNLDKMRAEKRRYIAKTKDKKKDYDKIYRPLNKEKIKQYKKDWEAKRRNDPIFKIKRNLRRRVNHVLKGNLKADKTFNLVGCSAEYFKYYIESLWKEGMSWENYGPKGWHIDHIKPCYKFNLLLESEQRECFHYLNQRPLWAWENLSRVRD